MTTRLPSAIYQFRLWEDSDFDQVVIAKLHRAAEERDAERIRRRLATPTPRSILRARRAELRAWESEQTRRIQDDERERMRLEAVATDATASEEDRRLARIELAGRLYRQQTKGDKS